jgi:hypothetical protein
MRDGIENEWHTLRSKLATQAAALEKAELECRAWRALAELQDGRYHVKFPARRTLGDFGGSVADKTKRELDGLGSYHVPRIYGEGATAQEAAVALATNAGLLDSGSTVKP